MEQKKKVMHAKEESKSKDSKGGGVVLRQAVVIEQNGARTAFQQRQLQRTAGTRNGRGKLESKLKIYNQPPSNI
ncbi:uncharacterized protein DS421_5g158590 [Arachis hypogaea]|nr:uncharacterized protein DS421_5g158590 [Arachis hypogaea]